ncbi:MAG: nucleotidyltransferase domain-containing protein, partial [Dethiobacter sp.]|nr:nucleotidyltransferase domain-containing protein [Dethiobacter sp.]
MLAQKIKKPLILFILDEIESHLKNIYGSKLKRIILYGSYARNDQNAESDLDI